MTIERWVELWDEHHIYKLTDIYGLHFLDYDLIEANVKTHEVEMAGMDGVMIGPNTLEPFEIKLNFYFDGSDKHDLNLFAEKIRKKLRTRNPFYIRHSYLPSIKYAINSVEIKYDRLNHSDANVSISFRVYKGYSESLYDTDQFSLKNGNWQFESGLLPDNSTKYRFSEQNFKVLNGSNDTIDPRLKHRLKIIIRLDSEKGFSLINKTTGDKFEFKSKTSINKQLTIDNGYPFIQDNIELKRCGRSTNHGIITLAPGYNKFEVWGDVKNFDIQFIFPFIYR